MLTRRIAACAPLLCVLFALPAQATMVKKMDLAEMAQAAGFIFRGTVVDTTKGSLSAASGKIPTITYQIRVSEQLKGSFPAASGGEVIVSITSVDHKNIEVPRLVVGQDYLMLTTSPSSAGLSTFVGLGQGLFRVYGGAGSELAVNTLNNTGLAAGLRGPAGYQDLADRIRSIVRKGSQP